MDKIFSLVSGIIFGVGLMTSGMTNPEKVIGFLSITHNWDASLIFVMGGGIFFTAPFFFLLRKRNKSSLGLEIKLPKNTKIDRKLLLGSALFGAGWGLAGLCPGPESLTRSMFFENHGIWYEVGLYGSILAYIQEGKSSMAQDHF